MSRLVERVDVDLDQGVLTLTLAGARDVSLGGEALRRGCPCAGCRGHGGERKPAVTPGVRLAGAEAVGSYALRLTFSDGHSTGIYTFEHLAALAAEAPGRADSA